MYASSKHTFQFINSVKKPHLDPPASDHIILVGSVQDLPFVILPLRSRLSGINIYCFLIKKAKPRDIVILHPTMPSEAHLKELEYLNGLHFIKVEYIKCIRNQKKKGSGLSYYDLQRAGIERASSILIRMSENSVNQSGSMKLHFSIHFPDHLRDSDALLTFISIETHIKNHNLNILVEIGIFTMQEMLIL